MLPENPEHHTEDVVGVHRGLMDHLDNPTHHLVYADALEEAGADKEAAVHRVIGRPGDEGAVRELAQHTNGDSKQAQRHTDRANWSEDRVRSNGANHRHAENYASRAADESEGPIYRAANHDNAAEAHRVMAGDALRRANNIDGGGGHWNRNARVLREATVDHLIAAAHHEAAAYEVRRA